MRPPIQAPARSGDYLAFPHARATPSAIAANQRLFHSSPVRIGGVPLQDYRRLARTECREILQAPELALDAPWLFTGHQPELSHPGVWVKNFALNRLAQQVNGVAVNLIVDHDAMKTASVAVPTWATWTADAVRAEAIPFDIPGSLAPYESARVQSEACWASFPERLLAVSHPWGWTPLLAELPWQGMANRGLATSGERIAALRRECEAEWGVKNHECTVSRLCQTESFRLFVRDISDHAERFRAIHNRAVRDYRIRHRLRSQTHPVPELTEGELPFWELDGDRRRAARHDSPMQQLRPRALTLTLFVRLSLADWFIHGLGGGLYDQVTDQIVQEYFGQEAPQFQIVTGTLHLPFPRFPATSADCQRLERQRRDLLWNPWRFGNPPASMVAERERLLRWQPSAKRERQQRYRELRALTLRDRERVSVLAEQVERETKRVEVELAANALLQRRDPPWILYPRDLLRGFLQGWPG